MSDTKLAKNTGAPLRIFFLLCMIWILSRIAWGSDLTQGSTINSEGNIDSELTNIAGALALNPMELQPYRIFDDGPTERGIITEFDFITIDVPTLRYPNSWTGMFMARNRMMNHLVNKRDVSIPLSTATNGGQNSLILPEHCCGEPAEAISRDETALSSNRNQKPAILGSRLSAYLWLFARSGSSLGLTNPLGTALQPGSAQYGGSQAGAILSYRLVGNQGRNIAVYSRVSSPLAVKGVGEVAIGAKVKPIKGLPISIYAESRFRESSSNRHGKAVFVAGGSGPKRIMHDVFLETYGQAGYVFQKNGSYFFDGSASIQKKLVKAGAGELSLGGAVWAGGQEGARRLDLGPRVNVDVPFGASTIRASVDWRQRVAGNAEPDSGLAVTLSTGF